MRGRTGWLVLALCMSASPAQSQTQESTRAETALAARQWKAETQTPYQPGRVERFLNRLENGGMLNLMAPADGFGIRIGGIESGSGLAVGPSWRMSNLWSGTLRLSASAARSITGDTGVNVGLSIPHVGTHRLAVSVDGSATRLARERFFGTGLGAERGNESAFSLSRDEIKAAVTLDAASWLRFSASSGTLSASSGSGRTRRVPSIETRFTPIDTPGLGVETRYVTSGLAATIDYRDVPQNPRSGGRYYFSAERYNGAVGQRYSFTRFDTELEQHFSAWKRQRVLTLRAIATATAADSGHDVPFYLQPTLGGSRVLRGFVTERFRDRNIVALQAEYGWDLLPFVSAVAFVEAGAAAPRLQELSLRELRKDYGLGFRFGSARTVAFRTDVAFGSGEGTRITMRFNHAF